MTAPGVFTLEAVNALVPRLRELMDTQLKRRADIEARVGQLSKLLGKAQGSVKAVRAVQVDPADSAEVRALKAEIIERVEKYEAAWAELETMGAVLKDPQKGLVDFYGRVDGKLVWLCWRHGEDAVTHYHQLNEGFAGRKPILDQLRHRHLN